MDIGTKVKCHRCATKFYMYYDTHGIEWGSVGGMCPNCNAYITSRVRTELLEFYPPPINFNDPVMTPVPYHGE